MERTLEARNAKRTDIDREAGHALHILLTRIKTFVEERGPEAAADFFGPFAKWGLILLHYLIDCDPDVKRITGFVFGVDTDNVRAPPRKSPLQVVGSSLLELVSVTDGDVEAAMCSSALVVCRLMILMLLMVVGGWRWAITFYMGFYAYHLDRIRELVTDEEALIFQAANFSLFVCDTIATPGTIPCRVLVLLLGLVVVFCARTRWKTKNNVYLAPACVSGFMILFYTPLWFGLCLLACVSAATYVISRGDVGEVGACLCCCGTIYSLVCLLAFLSGGGFFGALVLPLLFLLFLSYGDPGNEYTYLEMAAPLPFTCALLCCTYYPSLGVICITTTILCSLGLAYNNGKVIPWWFALLAALLFLSKALSGHFFVLVMGVFGSYFSYGYIL